MRIITSFSMGLCISAAASLVPSMGFAETTVAPSVYATGLQAPRGLRFGSDGNLYVAEAGTGGTNATTPAMCQQVPAPVGPYTGGMTGRISKVGKDHKVTTVASGFPSTMDAMGDLIGVADVAFLNGTDDVWREAELGEGVDIVRDGHALLARGQQRRVHRFG